MTYIIIFGAIMLILMFVSSCGYFYHKGRLDGMEFTQELYEEYIDKQNNLIEKLLCGEV